MGCVIARLRPVAAVRMRKPAPVDRRVEQDTKAVCGTLAIVAAGGVGGFDRACSVAASVSRASTTRPGIGA